MSWASNPLFMTSKWNLHPRGGTGDGEGERMRPRLPSKRNCKEDRAVPIHYEESSTSSSSLATNALYCGLKWWAVASGSPTKEFNFQSKCRSGGRDGKELILHFCLSRIYFALSIFIAFPKRHFYEISLCIKYVTYTNSSRKCVEGGREGAWEEK